MSLERRFSLEDRSPEFSKLLSFEPNLSEPIHRWFKFKEGFSRELVERLLREYPPKSRTVSFLDPFCGVGTSLLAAENALRGLGATRIKIRGVEVNPYMHFVATTKLDWNRYSPVTLLRAGTVSANGLRLRSRAAVPELSTLRNHRFVSEADAQRLVELREKVKIAAQGRQEVKPLLLGLAVAAERILNLRKDGRALRFTPRETKRDVDVEVERAWLEIAEDLQRANLRPAADWKVRLGDGRRADKLFKAQRFDVILFSPPYLNNIDYTEVYKVEQWLLGFLKSSDEMVRQRRRTFRSHPSCIFPQYKDADASAIIDLLGAPFQRLISYASADERWRKRLFTGYFADIKRTLVGCRRLLKSNGKIFLIVGNSVHGTPDHPIPVAADVWIATIAQRVGLDVKSILIGRSLPRRRMEWTGFRESIIVMSKAT